MRGTKEVIIPLRHVEAGVVHSSSKINDAGSSHGPWAQSQIGIHSPLSVHASDAGPSQVARTLTSPSTGGIQARCTSEGE